MTGGLISRFAPQGTTTARGLQRPTIASVLHLQRREMVVLSTTNAQGRSRIADACGVLAVQVEGGNEASPAFTRPPRASSSTTSVSPCWCGPL